MSYEQGDALSGCSFNPGAFCTGTGMCVWRAGRGQPCREQGDAVKENLCGVPGIPRGTIEDYARTLHPEWFDRACCHKTRLRDAPCPLGRKCPYDAPSTEGSSEAHLPVRTPPVQTPADFLSDWKVI